MTELLLAGAIAGSVYLLWKWKQGSVPQPTDIAQHKSNTAEPHTAHAPHVGPDRAVSHEDRGHAPPANAVFTQASGVKVTRSHEMTRVAGQPMAAETNQANNMYAPGPDSRDPLLDKKASEIVPLRLNMGGRAAHFDGEPL